MFANENTIVSSEPLYEVCGEREIPVAIERETAPDAAEEDARLLEISPSSITLETSSSPSIQEAVVVGIEMEHLGLHLTLSAVVKWSKPDDRNAFRIGCALSERLTEELLDELAIAGYLRPRQEPRLETSIDGHVRWEACNERVPVQITNLSTGGFCLCIPETTSMGSRLSLEVEAGGNGKVTVPAKVRWKHEMDGGSFGNMRCFFMGCEFTDYTSFGILASMWLRQRG